MYKYILFDLDGTLTDPAEGITNSVAYALARYGIKVEDKKQLYSFIGPPLVDSFASFYGFSKEKSREAVDVYREYFAEKGIFENKVYDGVRQMLENLKNAGLKLAVASSKPELYVRRILKKFDLEKYFSFVGGATMDETRVEKNQVIEYVLENMKITEKNGVLMVGDRKFDVLGAREMGIDALAVLYGYGTVDEFCEIGAENLADSPLQVENFILERKNMTKYQELLKNWCNSLIKYQIRELSDTTLNGGLVCPACKHIHGRTDNAVFPMLYMYSITGDKKYYDCAMLLFDWQKNLLCDDGGVYNDGNSIWKATTVFSVMGIYKALKHFGNLLGERKAEFEQRLAVMGDWLYKNLTPKFGSNINYQATCSAAMAYLSEYFGNKDYRTRAESMLRYCIDRINGDGMLWGEAHPHDAISKNGFRGIDIGYNVEESVPSLVEAAVCLKDESSIEFLSDVLYKQLDFMLPDGAWDNSFSDRNYKWTYYGSRTSDGCIGAYTLLKDKNPVFLAAAKRNADLLEACTFDGFLYGGPDYKAAGERPCIHHTFCHAVALAEAIICGIDNPCDTAIPTDVFKENIKYYKDVGTYKITTKNFIADFTVYDYSLYDSGRSHASGGTISLLYHKKAGPVVVSSVYNYLLAEPLNQQVSLQTRRFAPLTVRGEVIFNGEAYATCMDDEAKLQVKQHDGQVVICAKCRFANKCGKILEMASADIVYCIGENNVSFDVSFNGENTVGGVFVLPVLKGKAELACESNYTVREIFNFTPGFLADEYRITVSGKTNIDLKIKL